MALHSAVSNVTARIAERSRPTRTAYLAQVQADGSRKSGMDRMGCANIAHAVAGMPLDDRFKVVTERRQNIAIVTAYNDMLSAHTPLQAYPALIKHEARRQGATAQVAGGVPAMCDGVTQGTSGMELSLFSRDVIAMGTAVALSHDRFDAALMLGDGDIVRVDALAGELRVLVDDAEWAARPVSVMPDELRRRNGVGMGRGLFAGMRRHALTAEEGAMSWI